MMKSEGSSGIGNMKALILVGRMGMGSRSAPVVTRPTPLIEFANKPILEHQLDALVEAGVRHVVLAMPSQSSRMEQAANRYTEQKGVKIVCSYETEPLGTARPLALARKYLEGDSEPFFVLHSDSMCDYPFKDMVAFHKSHGCEGTIAVTNFCGSSKYGVVIYDDKGQIGSFMENPQEFVSNKINAGLYILNSKVLDRIELITLDIEKVILPVIAASQQLYAYELTGYWMDIGQPKDFLTGMCLYLQSEGQKPDTKLKFKSGPGIVGNVLMDDSVKIGSNCRIGPNVTVGKNVIIEDGVCIKRCTVLSGSKIGSYTWLQDCLVGYNSKIGQWVRMEMTVLLGDGNVIGDEAYLYNHIQEVVPFRDI